MPDRRDSDRAAQDLLILVDENDRVIGHETKARCHDGDGLLHRAFSVFLFNSRGALLLQQRSGEKRLWPLYWSNSCCSHPRKGEGMGEAASRRLFEELGIKAPVRELYKFVYQARYGQEGSEHELCSVFLGRSDHTPSVDAAEIAQVRYVDAGALTAEVLRSPEQFTPWFKLEWERLRRDFGRELTTQS